MSSTLNPWRARKSSATARNRVSTSCGISRENTALNPLSAISQPITSRVPGQVCSPLATTAGPEPSVDSKTPAAPSPNRAVATMLLLVQSSRRNDKAHNSTTRSSTISPGCASAWLAARARPMTPPAQPNPKIGNRLTSRRNCIRSINRASRLGVAMPVVDTVTTASIWCLPILARSRSLTVVVSSRSSAPVM